MVWEKLFENLFRMNENYTRDVEQFKYVKDIDSYIRGYSGLSFLPSRQICMERCSYSWRRWGNVDVERLCWRQIVPAKYVKFLFRFVRLKACWWRWNAINTAFLIALREKAFLAASREASPDYDELIDKEKIRDWRMVECAVVIEPWAKCERNR